MDSFTTITRLGGYIILFSIIAQMLTLFHLPVPLTAAIAALLEISSGTHALSALPLTSTPIRTALVCAGASFGGLCTCAQIISVLSDTDLDLKPWITGRLLLPLLMFPAVLVLLSPGPVLPGLLGNGIIELVELSINLQNSGCWTSLPQSCSIVCIFASISSVYWMAPRRISLASLVALFKIS